MPAVCPSRSYSYGPGLRWNVFEGGRLRSLVRVEEARTRQALVNYERTVLGAVEEVENALAAYKQESLREEALQRAVLASKIRSGWFSRFIAAA